MITKPVITTISQNKYFYETGTFDISGICDNNEQILNAFVDGVRTGQCIYVPKNQGTFTLTNIPIVSGANYITVEPYDVSIPYLTYADANVVGYYLNDITDVTADKSQYNNTLTNVGDVAIETDLTSPSGLSASFDGTNHLVSPLTFGDGQSENIFGSFWIKLIDGNPSAVNFIVNEFNSATDNSFYLRVSTAGKIEFGIRFLTSVGQLSSNFTFPDGLTDFVHLSFLTTDSLQQIFVNGVLDATGNRVWAKNAVVTPNSLFIGATNFGGSPMLKLNGYLSELKLFNKLPANYETWIANEYNRFNSITSESITITGIDTKITQNNTFKLSNVCEDFFQRLITSSDLITFCENSVNLTPMFFLGIDEQNYPDDDFYIAVIPEKKNMGDTETTHDIYVNVAVILKYSAIQNEFNSPYENIKYEKHTGLLKVDEIGEEVKKYLSFEAQKHSQSLDYVDYSVERVDIYQHYICRMRIGITQNNIIGSNSTFQW